MSHFEEETSTDQLFLLHSRKSVFDLPMFVSDLPMFVSDLPMFTFDLPMFVSDLPVFVSDLPMFVFDLPTIFGVDQKRTWVDQKRTWVDQKQTMVQIKNELCLVDQTAVTQGGNTNLILSQSTALLDKVFFVSFIQCTVSLWTAATGNKSRLVSTEMKQM